MDTGGGEVVGFRTFREWNHLVLRGVVRPVQGSEGPVTHPKIVYYVWAGGPSLPLTSSVTVDKGPEGVFKVWWRCVNGWVEVKSVYV